MAATYVGTENAASRAVTATLAAAGGALLLTVEERLNVIVVALRVRTKSAVAVWGTLPAPVTAALEAADTVTLMPWGEVPGDVRTGLAEGRMTRQDSTDEDSSALRLRRSSGPGRREIWLHRRDLA